MRAQLVGAMLRGGRSGVVIDILATSPQLDTATAPNGAAVILTFNSDGSLTITTTNSGTTTSSWMTGSTNGSAYAVQATVSAGSFSTGSTSLQPLSSNRQYSVSRSSLGTKEVTATFEIQPSGGGTALATKTLTLTASVES